jgi:nucleotide-binding universal stress UspA family protein
MRERAEGEAKPKLNESVRKIKEAGGEISGIHSRAGRPDAEIVALAEEIGAGLVIAGSRGRGPLKRALMGSVSNSVVRHAHCSVLVVRGNGREREYLPGRILLALDGSKEARAAARAAVEISTATDSELHVLSVTGDAPLGPYTPYPGPEAWEVSEDVLGARKEKAQAFLRRQVEQIEEAGGAVEEANLAFGAPAKEIVRTGEELGASLIVVGSRGLGTVGRTLIGSVSDSVVCHAACPVLVVREEDPVTRAGGG